MVIENNPKELAAMKKFHEGNRADGLKLDSFYYIIFGKWMDKFGNNAYPMIFGFLMGTAVLGMAITILMRKLIKKNN